MRNTLKSMAVPFTSFGIAILISLLTNSPLSEAKRRRADPTTGGCTVVAACNIQDCSTTFDPAAMKGEKQKELKDRADAAVAGCIKKNPNFLPKEIKQDKMAAQVIDGLQKINKGTWDAFTANSGAVLGDIVVSRVTPAPGTGGDVSLSLGGASLVLLPTDAPDLLKQHEPGHTEIFRYYWCVCFTAVMKKEVEKAICKTTFADEGALKLAAKNAAVQAFRDFKKKVGLHEVYEDAYDVATGNGTEGDQPTEI